MISNMSASFKHKMLEHQKPLIDSEDITPFILTSCLSKIEECITTSNSHGGYIFGDNVENVLIARSENDKHRKDFKRVNILFFNSDDKSKFIEEMGDRILKITNSSETSPGKYMLRADDCNIIELQIITTGDINKYNIKISEYYSTKISSVGTLTYHKKLNDHEPITSIQKVSNGINISNFLNRAVTSTAEFIYESTSKYAMSLCLISPDIE